jgi:hypothetical protein
MLRTPPVVKHDHELGGGDDGQGDAEAAALRPAISTGNLAAAFAGTPIHSGHGSAFLLALAAERGPGQAARSTFRY